MKAAARFNSVSIQLITCISLLVFFLSSSSCLAATNTITINPRPTGGTVVSTPAGINCGSGGSQCGPRAFTVGTTVSLNAIPASDRYTFDSWHMAGGSSTVNPYTNTMPPLNITGYVTFIDHLENGICGSDNNSAVPSTPTNLCSSGSASAVSGSGPWEWSCQGLYGGSDASCRADLLTFSPMAQQTWPKSNHTTTLLHNGKLLVTGGNTSTGPTATADLYDPASNSWSSAGNLAAVRSMHTATMLPNGKVLVVGGWGASARVASTEIYDPAANSWSWAAGMSLPRSNHSATLLADGRVLVAGGTPDGATGYTSAEIYDYTLNSWAPAATMLTAHSNHSATLLPDGAVLVAGGLFVTAAELYNPVTNAWSSAGSMSNAHALHSATLLPNGTVLVAGGQGNLNAPIATSELYNPQTNSWSAGGSLITPLTGHTASLLPNGRVLVTGGNSDNSGNRLAAAELYDPITNSWATAGSMAAARVQHTATVMADGTVAIIGGGSNGGWPTRNELYNPAVSSWTSTGSMAGPHEDHSATLLPDGKVLVAGGYNGVYLSTAELYDPSTGSWSAAGSLATARRYHTATLLTNGKVLVTGGYNGSYLSSAELYDPVAKSWSPAGNLGTARQNHTATLLTNGKVLISGGGNGVVLYTSELYDPATNSWSPAGSLTPTGRESQTTTLLPNGRVLAAGLTNASGYSAEEYNPYSNSWSATGNLTTPRKDHTATLLPNGKVLVAAGYSGGNAIASAELYDPATGSWSPAGSLATARRFHTATLLPNGKVLVSGGNMSGGPFISTAELYDPLSNSWSAAGSLTSTGAGYLRATLLLNGKVLISVGHNFVGSDHSPAMLFDPGLGFPESRRPVLSGLAFDPQLPNMLMAVGSGLRGDSEASSGGSANSSSGYPLLQLQRIDNDQSLYLLANPAWAWSDTKFFSTPISGLPAGHYRATVYVNGIPSLARTVLLRGYTVSFVRGNSNAGTLYGTTPQYVFPGVPSSAVSVVAGYPYDFLNWTGTNGFATTSENALVISNLSADMTVTANFTDSDVVAACGAAHNSFSSVKPSSALCAIGNASTVGGSGPWNWSCSWKSFSTVSCSTTGQPVLRLTVSGSGNGSVTISSSLGNSSCTSGSCPQPFPYNTAVGLLPTANSISVFGGWNSSCSAFDKNCDVTMNTDRAAGASFNPADRARIASSGFTSLALAYDSITSSTPTTITVLDANLAEIMNMNQAWNVILWGGWKADYSGTSGLPTILHRLTIKAGSLSLKGKLAIR